MADGLEKAAKTQQQGAELQQSLIQKEAEAAVAISQLADKCKIAHETWDLRAAMLGMSGTVIRHGGQGCVDSCASRVCSHPQAAIEVLSQQAAMLGIVYKAVCLCSGAMRCSVHCSMTSTQIFLCQSLRRTTASLEYPSTEWVALQSHYPTS